MTTSNLCLFVPATADPHPEMAHVASDLDRLKFILLPSIRKFIPRDLYYRIIILTPDKDLELARDSLVPFADIGLQFLPDSAVLPESVKFHIPWFKQQVLKLKTFEHVPTDLYLILDADLVVTRSVRKLDLFHAGKPRVSFARAKEDFRWWTETAKTLGYPISLDPNQRVPHFTPQILNKSLVRQRGRRNY